jgi:Protein of unknown function (DUF1566)
MATRHTFIILAAAMALGWAGTAGAATAGVANDIQALIDVCGDAALLGLPPAPCQQFPATGQTTVYRTGDDGDVQAGATLDYTDNGDGTITDNNTRLQWAKKSSDGSIHDVDDTYTWEDAFAVYVAGLNTANFAGHNDWRLANAKELQSIVNYQNVGPAVSAAFNTGCAANCTVTTCSCTAAANYWSSTTSANEPAVAAWVVNFNFGFVVARNKSDERHVRAVRGGLGD